jgi:uncharacterized membrane protein YgdD (TMEM256/DUF423 family)
MFVKLAISAIQVNKRIILTASFFGLTAVILGAFGTHGLKGRISEQELTIWRTAVEYQFYHTFALLFLSLALGLDQKFIGIASYLFTSGILLFSGSLYLLVAESQWIWVLWPLTPLGGLCFILGWICLFLATLKSKNV